MVKFTSNSAWQSQVLGIQHGPLNVSSNKHRVCLFHFSCVVLQAIFG